MKTEEPTKENLLEARQLNEACIAIFDLNEQQYRTILNATIIHFLDNLIRRNAIKGPIIPR